MHELRLFEVRVNVRKRKPPSRQFSYVKLLDFIRRNGGQSLQQIEEDDWGDPAAGETTLVSRCRQLRRTPIQSLSSGDISCLINQGIGLQYLVPQAIAEIEIHALEEARLYPGDLLVSVLRVDSEFWRKWPELKLRIEKVLAKLENLPDRVAREVQKFRG